MSASPSLVRCAETQARHDAATTLTAFYKTSSCPSDMRERNPIEDEASPSASPREISTTESTAPTLSRDDQETPTTGRPEVIIEIPSSDDSNMSSSENENDRLETQPRETIEITSPIEILSSDDETTSNASHVERESERETNTTRKRPLPESSLKNGQITKHPRTMPTNGNESNARPQHANFAASGKCEILVVDGSTKANEPENAAEEISPKNVVLGSGSALTAENSKRNCPTVHLDCPVKNAGVSKPVENAEVLKATTPVGQHRENLMVKKKESQLSTLDGSDGEVSSAKDVSDKKLASSIDAAATGTEHSSSDMDDAPTTLKKVPLTGSTAAPPKVCQDEGNGYKEYEAIVAPDKEFGIGLSLSANENGTIVSAFKKNTRE